MLEARLEHEALVLLNRLCDFQEVSFPPAQSQFNQLVDSSTKSAYLLSHSEQYPFASVNDCFVARTDEPASRLTYLLSCLSENASWVHGNLLCIHDTGVLLTGEPGAGKSHLSLLALSRGHKLVSDDIVYQCIVDGVQWGVAPIKTAGWLHVRGTGFFDVKTRCPRAMTGPVHKIDMQIHLLPGDDREKILRNIENVCLSQAIALSQKKEENGCQLNRGNRRGVGSFPAEQLNLSNQV